MLIFQFLQGAIKMFSVSLFRRNLVQFQFLQGTIKTTWVAAGLTYVQLFQFLQGTIDTGMDLIVFRS